MVFDSLDRMSSQIEAHDVREFQLFDARGRPLAAVVDGYRVASIGAVPGTEAHPEELEALLRHYFHRLPERFQSYSRLAAQARSLDELVRLRWELEKQPAGTS